MRKRGQGYSLELIVSASVFLVVTVGILATVSLSDNNDAIPIVEDDVSKFVGQFFSTGTSSSEFAFVENNVINNEKLARLQELSYEQLQNRLGLSADFCIVFVDKDGNLKPLNGMTGIGAPTIMTSAQSSCADAVLASQTATELSPQCRATLISEPILRNKDETISLSKIIYGDNNAITCTPKMFTCLEEGTWDDSDIQDHVHQSYCNNLKYNTPETTPCTLILDDGDSMTFPHNTVVDFTKLNNPLNGISFVETTIENVDGTNYHRMKFLFNETTGQCPVQQRICNNGIFQILNPNEINDPAFRYPFNRPSTNLQSGNKYTCGALPKCRDGVKGIGEDGVDCSNPGNSVCTTLGSNGVSLNPQFCKDSWVQNNTLTKQWCDGNNIVNNTIMQTNVFGNGFYFTATPNPTPVQACPNSGTVCKVANVNSQYAAIYALGGCEIHNGEPRCKETIIENCNQRSYCENVYEEGIIFGKFVKVMGGCFIDTCAKIIEDCRGTVNGVANQRTLCKPKDGSPTIGVQLSGAYSLQMTDLCFSQQ